MKINDLMYWCANCNTHHSLHAVRKIYPAPEIDEGEHQAFVCPACDSFDVRELQEVSDE